MHRRNSTVLLITGILSFAAFNFYTPALSAVFNSFPSFPTLAKLSVSLYIFAKGISMLLYAPVIERLNPKTWLLIGVVIFIIGSLTCAGAIHPLMLLAGRIAEGIGASLLVLIELSMMNQMYSKNSATRMLSLVFFIQGLLRIALPILGGYVTEFWGWRMLFIILTIASVVCLFLVLNYISLEAYKKPMPGYFRKNAIAILKSRIFWGYVSCFALILSTTDVFCTGAVYLFSYHGGLNAIEFGYLYTSLLLGYILGLVTCLILNQRLRPFRFFSIAVYLTAIASLFLVIGSFIDSISLQLTLIYFMMLIIMYLSGIALIITLVEVPRFFPQHIALVTTMGLSVVFIIGAAFSILISFFDIKDSDPVLFIIGSCGILCLILFWLLLMPIKKRLLPDLRPLTHH
ncbi:MAG: MFS transporter [Francisellaceae bacterium]